MQEDLRGTFHIPRRSSQAATIARDADVKKMGLIHYSPRYTDKELQILKEEACEIFPNTVLCRDRNSYLLTAE